MLDPRLPLRSRFIAPIALVVSAAVGGVVGAIFGIIASAFSPSPGLTGGSAKPAVEPAESVSPYMSDVVSPAHLRSKRQHLGLPSHDQSVILRPPIIRRRANCQQRAFDREGAMIQVSHAVDQWAEGWSSHNMETVASVFTEDCIYEDVALGVVNRGKEELKAFGNGFIAGVPDLRVEVTSRFASGDMAAAEWGMSGTHKGDLPGMPATGKTFSLRGVSIFQMRGDSLIRCSDYWDLAAFQKQLGFMS